MSERTDLDGTYYSGAAQAPSLCSCKASQRDGQHMAWCPSLRAVAQDVPEQATLKRVANLFAKSVHETYTREEVVSGIEDMIRLGPPVQSEHLEAATKLLKEVMPLLEDQGYLPEVRKIRAVLKEIERQNERAQTEPKKS